MNTWSKPAFRTLPRLSTAIRVTIGIMPGRVTCRVCFQRLAPSTMAASYRWRSIAVSAAR
ncbi:hypothetical protein D3C75_1203860 [compost metagenome]